MNDAAQITDAAPLDADRRHLIHPPPHLKDHANATSLPGCQKMSGPFGAGILPGRTSLPLAG